MNRYAKGMSITYMAATAAYPWIRRVWKHLQYLPYQNQAVQKVEVITKFDVNQLLNLTPFFITDQGGIWQMVEKPFVVEKGIFGVLNFNILLDNKLVHMPGKIIDQLPKMNMLSPDYIIISSITGYIGTHRLMIFKL